MSKVDKRPRYKHTAATTIAAVFREAGADGVWFASMVGMDAKEIDIRRAKQILDDAYFDAKMCHFSYSEPEYFSHEAERIAKKSTSFCGNPYVIKGKRLVVEFAALLKDRITSAREGHHAALSILLDLQNTTQFGHRVEATHDYNKTAKMIIEAQAQTIKQTQQNVAQVIDKFIINDTHIVSFNERIRKAMHGAIQKEDYHRFASLRANCKNPIGLNSDADEYFTSRSARITALFGHYKCYTLHGVLIMIKDGVGHFLTGLDCRNIAEMIDSMKRAQDYAFCARETSLSLTTRDNLRYALTTSLQRMISHQIKSGDAGGHVNAPVRAVHIMHQSWLQGFDEDDASFDKESKNRESVIAKEAHSVYPGVDDILEPIFKLGLSRIHVFDLLKLHQVSVSQDWSVADIETKCQTQGTEGFEHPINEAEYKIFQGFCDAMDVRDFYKMSEKLPKMEGTPVPDALVADWKAGKFVTPPRSVWGKFWIAGQYPIVDVASDWHMSAKDVTHLTCKGVVTNQLAFALENGAKLEDGKEFEFWLDMARSTVLEGGKPRTSYHYVAPKAEGAKIEPRVTASGDSVFRQMQRNNEANQRVFNKMVGEVALGSSVVQGARKLHEFYTETQKLSNKVVSGHDVTAWSVHQARQAVKDNIDRSNRATRMSEIDRKVYTDIWDDMMFILNRGGFERRFEFKFGSMQGYPGHSDSYHHVRIQQYIAFVLREKKLISGVANVRALIDDALMALSLYCKSSDTGPTWVKVWKVLCDTYKRLGYEIDQIKSVVGMCKFIFLNEAMYKGLILPTALKTLIKAQLPSDIAIPELKECERSIISTAAKSAYVGLSPLAAYYLGVKYALIERNRVCGDMKAISSSKAAALALLPEPGWGYPSLAATICVGSGDYYLDSECILVNAASHFIDPTGSSEFWDTIAGYDELPSMYTSALAIMKDSSVVKKAGPISADAVRKQAVSRAMKRSNIKFAEPFSTVIDSDKAGPELNSWVNAMMCATMPLPLVRAISSCSVFSVADQIMDMIAISSCLSQFISGRGVMAIRKLVRSQDITCHKYGCKLQGTGSVAIQTRVGTCATQTVNLQREAALNANSMKWSHHTYSHPADLLKVGREITGTPIGFSSAKVLDLGGNQAFRQNIEPADCVHMSGIETGTGGSSLFLETGSSVVASHPYAKKIVMGISLIRVIDPTLDSQIAKCFFDSWGLSDMSIGSSVSISKGSLKRIMGNPQDVDYYPKFARGIFRGAYVDANSIFSVCESTVVNVKCLTWYLRHCAALGAVHSPGAMKRGFSWFVSYDPRALVEDITSGGSTGDASFPPAVDGDGDDWDSLDEDCHGEESLLEGAVRENERSVFHSIISTQAVHTAIDEWNDAMKEEASVANPGFTAQCHKEIPKLAAVMKKSSTGFKSLRFIPGQVRASEGATFAILRNAAIHHVKQVAQDAEFYSMINLEQLVNRNSLSDSQAAGRVFGKEKLWRSIKGIVETGKMTLDAATAYRHVVYFLTSLHNFADLDPQSVASAVGASYDALLKLANTAVEGYTGKSSKDYSIRDRVIIVARDPERINAAERARDLSIISCTDISRCQDKMADLNTAKSRGSITDKDYNSKMGYLEGCTLARNKVKYGGDGLVDVIATLDGIREFVHRQLLREVRAAEDKAAMDFYNESQKKGIAMERPAKNNKGLQTIPSERPETPDRKYVAQFLRNLLNEVDLNDANSTALTAQKVAGIIQRLKYAIGDAKARSKWVYAVSPEELVIAGVQRITPMAGEQVTTSVKVDTDGSLMEHAGSEQFGFGLDFTMNAFAQGSAASEAAFIANLLQASSRVSEEEKEIIITTLEGELTGSQREEVLEIVPNFDPETLEIHWEALNEWLMREQQEDLRAVLCGDPIS